MIEDFDRLTIERSSSPFARAFGAALDALTLAGAEYDWARTCPAPLVRAGLGNVAAVADVAVVQGATPIAELVGLTIDALADRSLEAGLIDRDEIDPALAWLEDPASWDLAPIFVAAWGQKQP